MTDDSDRRQPRNPLGPTGERVMANVKKLRQAQGLTYKDLSDRLENLGRPIPVLGLSRLERGERRVDVDDLVALAVALKVTPNRLLLPSTEVEHASDMYQLTPSVRGIPVLLWAWASGEVPLGRNPSKVVSDRTARNEEVSFGFANRPDLRAPSPPGHSPSTEQSYAMSGIVAFVTEAFNRGLDTARIRSIVEAGLSAALIIGDPATARIKIEADGAIYMTITGADE